MNNTRHENLSSERASSVPSHWSIQICGHGHTGCATQVEICIQYVNVLRGRNTKVTRSIPLTTAASTNAATVFVSNWVIPCGDPPYLPTDGELNFVSKFFFSFTVCLAVKQLTKTACLSHAKNQVKHMNRTFVARLGHYVAEHQTDCDHYVQLLSYKYNGQVQLSIGTTPSIIVPSGQPPGPDTLNPASIIPKHLMELSEPVPFQNWILRQLDLLIEAVDP